MTVFVIAVGAWALVEFGIAIARTAAGESVTRTPGDFAVNAVMAAVLAGGALAALLV